MPRWMAPSIRVVFAATWMPAWRRALVAFWDSRCEHRAVPGPGRGGQNPGLARARRAGDHFHGAGRGKRVPTAAAWSSRSPRGAPCSRGSRARPGQCRAKLREVGAETPRGQLA